MDLYMELDTAIPHHAPGIEGDVLVSFSDMFGKEHGP